MACALLASAMIREAQGGAAGWRRGCVLAELLPEARMTLTWDQGREMARHDLLAGLLVDGVFFAHPAMACNHPQNRYTVALRQPSNHVNATDD